MDRAYALIQARRLRLDERSDRDLDVSGGLAPIRAGQMFVGLAVLREAATLRWLTVALIVLTAVLALEEVLRALRLM